MFKFVLYVRASGMVIALLLCCRLADRLVCTSLDFKADMLQTALWWPSESDLSNDCHSSKSAGIVRFRPAWGTRVEQFDASPLSSLHKTNRMFQQMPGHQSGLSYISASRYAGRMMDSSPTRLVETAFPKGHTRRPCAMTRSAFFCGFWPKVTENTNLRFCKVDPAR